MAIKSRAELKARFQKNKIPTQDDFANLIESAINLADDGVRKSSGDPLSVKAEGATQELLAFYQGFEAGPTPAWKINRKPGTNPGFNIATGDGTSRLFIDERTGAVNIGGINPVRTAEPGMLQLGDDTTANSNGQLLLARHVDVNRNRAFKIGVTDDCHLSIYDLGHVGNRAYAERLTIEHGGRISVKKGLEVNELLQANSDTVITGKLDVTGTVSVNDGIKVKGGVITWGDGALGSDTKDPGIYSTINGTSMKFATVNAPIKFFNNKADEQAAAGRPNMIIGKNGTVGVGTDDPLAISGCNVLQIGDDSIEGSSGQLIFGRKQGRTTRSVKMGVDNDGSFSLGDFGPGNSATRVYTEHLNINWQYGLVAVKKSLSVSGKLDASDNVTVGGNVAIGSTDPYTIAGSQVLTIGDDRKEGSSGQLIFGRKKGGITRSVRMGVDNEGSFSVGDFGNEREDTKVYKEYLNINWQYGQVNIKNDVRIGVTNPIAIAGSTLLQIGDDKVIGSRGELIFGMNRANTQHRSFKMGLNTDGYFSLGDYGNKDGKNYIEFFQIRDTGEVIIRKKLQVDGSLFVAGVPAELDLSTKGSYISNNGETLFGNSSDDTHDGGFGFMNKNKDNQRKPTKLAFLSSTGDLYIKGKLKADNTTHVSDIRVKTNIRSSDGEQDLALLNKLRITNYDFLANGKRNEQQKGVIAQELEKLIPEAISHDKSFVADIFAEPAKITAVGKDLLLTMAQPHHLIDGDVVRFIFPNGETEHAVAVIDENSFRVEGNAEDFKDVIVYGKQVNDFRRVNYHQLFLLNLSATQELSKKIDVLLAWKASLDKKMVLVD